ncbi:GMP synthase [Histoplasma capsulatum var. duboisii H88]|uniref:GMP synthase [glutamine-hydrolyzing] n=1 Tax=Ajellomyces capsulatus (strain H88) TaxID=544711 RepID=F0UF70_AJEC8|nr:GMP synthase [Histoplasma capsulatum var. duboisii H88]
MATTAEVLVVEPHMAFDTILVLDFGSQYSHLITRRLRELNIYSEMLPCTQKIADLSWKPTAVILSGSPYSVYAPDAPHVDPAVFDLGVPVLGICYGLQMIAWNHGKNVSAGDKREYGHAKLNVTRHAGKLAHIDKLFEGLEGDLVVWMSHGDKLSNLPENFVTIATTANAPFAGIAHTEKPIYGIQFHPELTHTPRGKDVLRNFAVGIAKAEQNWTMGEFVSQEIDRIRKLVGEKGQVIGAVSGGVDSTVAAKLMQEAIGNRFHAVLVDNGVLRLNEAAIVKETLTKHLGINLTVVDASERFLGKLKGITDDPEKKRKVIGNTFIEVFQEEAKKIEQVRIAREADHIFIEEIKAAGLYRKISQAFAALLPVKAVGVMGDQRVHDQVIALRAVETTDFMTADWYPFDGEFLKTVSRRIVNEVKGVCRVVYDTNLLERLKWSNWGSGTNGLSRSCGRNRQISQICSYIQLAFLARDDGLLQRIRMSGLRGIVKEGWHPKGKDGGRESWRGDFKGINQVAGWVGKGKSTSDGHSEHASRSIASLRDPASFPPPPKHINRHGGGGGVSSPTPGLGTSLSAAEIQSLHQQGREEQQTEEAERSKKVPPPVPFRANTTGLSTDNFLPPPVRRLNAPTGSADELRSKQILKPKPSLPPRLPPRGAAHPSPSPSPPPAYHSSSNGIVSAGNTIAIDRLGNAGVSVPSLGIHKADSGPQATGSSSTGGISSYTSQNELQERFSRMNTSPTSSASSAAPIPAEGTAMEQKQHALRTAHSFSRDPTSISASDARSAVSTTGNFRERHSEQIESGKKKLFQLDQKYGISKRINNFIEDQKSPAYPDPQPPPPANAAHSPQRPPSHAFNRPDLEVLNNRKPPPPPPPKKPSIQPLPVDGPPQVTMPPPLPLGTKPR